jgi:hypothetical protein
MDLQMPTSFITIPVPSTSLPFNTPNIVSRTAKDVLVVAIVNINCINLLVIPGFLTEL